MIKVVWHYATIASIEIFHNKQEIGQHKFRLTDISPVSHTYLDAISIIIFNEIHWDFFLYGQTRTKYTICVKIFKI